MQISATPIIANVWGQAVTGAMDDAVSAGFGGNPQALSPAGAGFTYYFIDDAPAQQNSDADQESLRRYLTSPDGTLTSPNGSTNSAAANTAATDSVKRVDNDFAALGYAGGMPTKGRRPCNHPLRVTGSPGLMCAAPIFGAAPSATISKANRSTPSPG